MDGQVREEPRECGPHLVGVWGPGGPRMSGEVVQRLGGSRSSRSSSENGPWRELCSAFALGADSGGIGSIRSLAFLQMLSCAAVLSISSPSPSFGRQGGERGGFRAESETTTCAFGEAAGPIRRML